MTAIVMLSNNDLDYLKICKVHNKCWYGSTSTNHKSNYCEIVNSIFIFEVRNSWFIVMSLLSMKVFWLDFFNFPSFRHNTKTSKFTRIVYERDWRVTRKIHYFFHSIFQNSLSSSSNLFYVSFVNIVSRGYVSDGQTYWFRMLSFWPRFRRGLFSIFS